jgi:flagellar biosynthesis/type III secretory pathway chaperone
MDSASDRLSPLLGELQQLLVEERNALLAGNPEQITDIAARKLALAGRIEAEAAAPGAMLPGPEALVGLDRYNRQNGAICAAMLRHMVQAIDKLRRHEPHRSYRPDGSERELPARHTLGAA